MKIHLDDEAFFWSRFADTWQYFDSQKLAMMRLLNSSDGIIDDYDAEIVFSNRNVRR